MDPWPSEAGAVGSVQGDYGPQPASVLHGKVAMVTGASVPMVRQIALRLAAEGASTAVTDHNGARARVLAGRLRAMGTRAVGLAADPRDTDAVTELLEEVVRALDRLDVLVHVLARVGSSVPFLDLNESRWDDVVHSRLKSAFVYSQRAARLMVQHGTGGCILIVSPFAGIGPLGSLAAYGAAHGAIGAFVGSIARDLAPFGIRANLVIPHPVHERRVGANGGTAGLADDDTGANRAELEHLELLDAASAIAFLASDSAAHVTGQSIHVGGRSRY